MRLAQLCWIPFLVVWAAQAGAETEVVKMVDYQYQPERLQITVGTTVRWENHERRTSHDVYFPDLDVASPRLFPEEYWAHQFNEPGTYHYHCRPHEDRDMRGVIEVVAANPSAASLQGYGTLHFGMSVDEVRSRLDDVAVTTGDVYRSDGGDLILDAQSGPDVGAAGFSPDTDLRFVFPAESEGLALVLEFHPDADRLREVRDRLEARYGPPWADDLSQQWFEQLKAEMPDGVSDLVIWGGDGDSRQRFVRLWQFEDYLSVEYLDASLL